MGAVLAAKVVGTTTFPAAEREAYHRALVQVAGADAGRTLAAWRAYLIRLDAPGVLAVEHAPRGELVNAGRAEFLE